MATRRSTAVTDRHPPERAERCGDLHMKAAVVGGGWSEFIPEGINRGSHGAERRALLGVSPASAPLHQCWAL